jgi:hypothetical protein
MLARFPKCNKLVSDENVPYSLFEFLFTHNVYTPINHYCNILMHIKFRNTLLLAPGKFFKKKLLFYFYKENFPRK